MTEDPRIDPADLRNVRFPGSSRRYDARSVDQFLETVAVRIAATNALVDDLQARLGDLEAAGPAPAAAVPPPQLAHLDEDELVRLLGEETTSVLSTARRAAEEIRSKAEEAAARMVREATAEADRLTTDAQTAAAELTGEAEQALERATAEATAEATRIRDAATAEAEETTSQAAELAEAELAAAEQRRSEADAEVERILEEAREEGRGMVNEAKEVRTRVLDDLQRRRDTARDQIERLLAGRERLLAAYELVRENLDDITGQLADALPDPGEPELPDGFVGVVGSSNPPAQDADAGAGADADLGQGAPAGDSPVEVDDTVAPSASVPTGPGQVEDDLAPVPDADVPGGDPLDLPPEGAAFVEDDTTPGGDAAVEDDLGPVAEADRLAAVESVPVDSPGGDGATDIGSADQGDAGADEAVDDSAEADPEPAADSPTELDADEAAEHAAGGTGDVDALFARLRAEREESVTRARELAQVDGSEDVGAGDEPGDPAGPPDAEGDVDRIPQEFLAPEAALAARTEALDPLDGALSRALKRRLADEQNELLDLLRRSGTTDAAELLPDLVTQVGGYARVAEKHLRTAAKAGAGGAVDTDVAPLAQALGAALVEPFRRRVERSASEVDGDADELDERLRALYREWKVQHIGPVTKDALLSAYALGTLGAAEPGTGVRWLIDPAQGPCPDAQDNALAGEQPAGESFPTGDVCPQAHPGCHCLLTSG